MSAQPSILPMPLLMKRRMLLILGGAWYLINLPDPEGNPAAMMHMAQIRGILDYAGVAYQTAELGKVDIGGGGTIAYIMALYGMDVIDCGVAVLNMHAPWEITSKADVYEVKKGYVVFLQKIFG